MTAAAELERLQREVARLEAWVADLQSGMYVRYGPGETTPVSMAEALKRHVATCERHPMAGLAKALVLAWHALRSYQYGNGTGELARQSAEEIARVLAAAGRPLPAGLNPDGPGAREAGHA